MTSSSSSASSSCAAGKKGKKKEKKDKKRDKKKDKKKGKEKEKKVSKKAEKQEKQKEKADKRAKATDDWFCDRAEATRLLVSLLTLDDGITEELSGVFESIDGGDVVRLDDLQDKQAKKKLRHLLQAFKLQPVEGQGFRTPSKKVSFVSLYEACLEKARSSSSSGAGAAAVASAASPSPQPPAQAGESSPRSGSPAAAPESAASPSGAGPEETPSAPQPRRVGPQLPGASVGPAGGDGGEGSSEDEGEEEDKGAGPRLVGQERQGVDLDSMPRVAQRESWMTTPHDSIAGAFSDVRGPRKADKYEIARSKAEQEQFEKLYKARGPSLLQEKTDGKFTAHEEEMESARKRKSTVNDLWGLTEKDQVREAATAGESAIKAPRKAFDPEQDMQVRKPMSGEDFSKLVENSVSGLAGRFGRGQVATSFL